MTLNLKTENAASDRLSSSPKWKRHPELHISNGSVIPLAGDTASDRPSSPSKWKRHPELYMSDGSVVLLAGNTLFKIYLQWLAKKSEVFANLSSFDKVQPEDADTYDGCPLVRVTDSAKDMEYFLMGLDACSDFFFPDRPTSFAATSAILQLSTKYMVSRLREKAVYHLCRLYPTSFDDMNPDHKDLSLEVFGTTSGPEHPIILVNLAQSSNLTKLLPWAYYSVIRWSFRDMVIGHKCHDGTTVHLSDHDKQKCLLGFESLMSTQHANIKNIFAGPSPRCQGSVNNIDCVSGISDALKRALDEHGTGLIAPLGPLRRKVNACEKCLQNIRHLDLELRKKVWDKLPEVFDLPPWSQLLEEEEE